MMDDSPPSSSSLLINILLFGIIAPLCLAFVLYQIVLLMAPSMYRKMISNNTISVDEFVCQPNGPSSYSCLKCVLIHYTSCGTTKPKTSEEDVVVLRAEESDKVPGLKVTYRKEDGVGESIQETKKKLPPPLVVGTIRMGFGHHRIAYATCSWGLDEGDKQQDGHRDTYFHDLLNIDSEEATMIKDKDKLYSKASRLASEIGGPIESLWGSITKSGDEDSLRATYQFAEHLRPIICGLDKDSPIIASHCLVAAAAVAAGYTNVINLVIDNYAQWFIVVPGCLNLVQGPTNYHNLLKMGVSPENLQLVGHWIPKDLVEGIPTTCFTRIRRAKTVVPNKKPIRMILPVGGAGAQRYFVTELIKALASKVKSGHVQLFLNSGDHVHMKESFVSVLNETCLDYDVVPDMDGVRAFQKRLQTNPDTTEPLKPVTLFAFDDYFTAVATTDILCNVSDVLACKPSELAFYPIPKLMIRRVGDHEEYSALRASELGDGTLEARTLKDCLRYVDIFYESDLLIKMNEAIIKNNSIGIYNGCKEAVRLALERSSTTNK